MKQDLIDLVSGGTGVAALVEGRVSWAWRPQDGDFPAIVLTQVSDVPGYTYAAQDDLRNERVQVDVYATSPDVGSELADLVDRTLSAFRGVVGATEFQGIFLQSRFEAVERPASGADPVFRSSRDVMVHHKEA